MKKILILILLSCCSFWVNAQELNGKVTVRSERLQGVDAKLLEQLEAGLNQMVNNSKWTEDAYKAYERIECAFLLNLTARDGNVFSGTLTITASRPIFNSGYTSPLINHIDRQVRFKYEQGQTIVFDEQRIKGSDQMASNLTAIFGYYINLILGLNYDSFRQGGGTEYFKKAQNVVINAPDEKGIEGWKSSDANNKNRFFLIDQFLNPRFSNFRPYFYTYHRYGMDQMAEKPEEGRNAILDGLTNIETIAKENPNSVLLQFFFQAKSTEFINLLKSTPDPKKKEIASLLARIDVSNAAKYNEIR
jgi:hypothetical protein